MEITAKECAVLRARGYSVNDTKEIRIAAKKTEYFTIGEDNKKIKLSEKEAYKKLGHELWLKTICKSAFEINAQCLTDEGETIHFHSKVYIN